MRGRFLAIAFLASTVAPALAQTSQPFDMSGERTQQGIVVTPPRLTPPPAAIPLPPAPAQPVAPPIQPAPAPTPVVTPPPAPVPSAPEAPIDALAPPAQPGVSPDDGTGQPPAQPAAADTLAPPTQASPAAPAAAPPEPVRPPAGLGTHFLIPTATFRLAGETDQRSWSIYLAAAEVAQASRLDISYKNAVVVAPEGSRLWVSINNQPVMEVPLASSENWRTATVQVPAGLLQVGANTVRFLVSQRHRTDCTVQSTYELWTDIDPAGTTLTFPIKPGDRPIRSLEDIAAVGHDAKGVTKIHVIAPSSNQTVIAPYLMKLVQAITLFGYFPTPTVQVSEGVTAPDGNGSLTVVLGTANEANGLLSRPLLAASDRPAVTFVDDARLGQTVLVVSGPSWAQIGVAIDAIASRVDRPGGSVRKVLATSSWLAPDTRYFSSGDRVRISELGLTTQEFSGRRFRASFAVGMPPDFYADAYGHATLLLDAAYSATVEASSHIDIYVNDQIAATTRVQNKSGGIFRHMPIQVPLRHFHPGINRVSMETILDTAADAVCAPGGSMNTDSRFALFDTTEFDLPDFASIGRSPDLAAFSGIGYPYAWAKDPAALVLGRADPATYGAAATLLTRLATQAGRVLAIVPTAPAGVGDRAAIFVGAISQISTATLSQMGIAQDAQTDWRDETRPNVAPVLVPTGTAPLDAAVRKNGGGVDDGLAQGANGESTTQAFDRWRTQLSGSGVWSGQISGFEDWLQRTFDISFASLRIGTESVAAFQPTRRMTLLISQALSPGHSSTWTLVTAPSDASLSSGMAQMVDLDRWQQLDGRLTAFSGPTDKIETQPLADFQFVETRPFSLSNYRLIAANWLSSNILFYAFGLVALCGFLGFITTSLLYRLGRPS